MRFVALVCCLLIASMATAKDLKVGTVDLKKLFNEYPGTEKAQKKFKAFALKKQKDLSDPEEELTDLQKQLEGSSSVLSAKEKKKKAAEYQTKLREYAQLKNQITNDLAAKESEMTQGILDEIKAAVAGVARDKGVDLVLDSEKTVYVNGGTDLTEAVLKSGAYKNKDSDSDDSGSKKK